MKNLITLLALCAFVNIAHAQSGVLPSGIKYRVLKKGTGKASSKIGDMIICKIKGTVSGKTIFDSKEVNKGVDNAINFKIVKPQFKGDVMEGLMMMREGDSTEFRVPQDSFYRGAKPPFVKKGDDVIYIVKCINLRTPAQLKAEQDAYKKQQAEIAKFQKTMKRQQDSLNRIQSLAKAQIKKDDKIIATYLAEQGITNAKKTASGLYIAIDQEGNGEKPKSGDEVKVNYTGTFLDGKKFDSSVDSAFGHMTPYAFKLGQRQVISAWDEGIAALTKGAKAKLIAPSSLAYGSGGNGNIPANSVLRFDVELLDFEKALTPEQIKAKDEKAISDYMIANNITNAKMLPGGLYVQIIEEGSGASPSKGDAVSMNYTGTLVNGTKFDSNIDSTFGHVTPLSFNLGTGGVIKGWDDAIATLKKGSKAKLLIPSIMAYGGQARSNIPANSPLIFDVEVLDFTKPTKK
jgi:FKBP-type peptidyl-prolyl cis-trans isomerase FkpA